MKGIPKTPVEFDYDLWTTEDGKCMVRIKATGEVTEVERTVMQVLRSEEKRFRRAMSLDQEADRDGISTTQNIYPLTSRIQCSECGSYFRRRQVSGAVKWGCSKHIQDRTQCSSNYYSEERIYDAFVAMVNKLRFSEYDIMGQTLLRLESAELKRKQKNTAARELSRNIADLNAKLVMVEQLHAKGYLKDEVHKAQVREINDQLRQLKRERQCEFSSGITHMIEELTRLKKLLEELEEPLDRFDEKLFTEIVQAISISHRDEMTVTLIGGLRFTEML